MFSYRQISEILKVGIWQSPSSFMKEAQDWIAQTNFNVNQYGTTNSDISGNPDFTVIIRIRLKQFKNNIHMMRLLNLVTQDCLATR